MSVETLCRLTVVTGWRHQEATLVYTTLRTWRMATYDSEKWIETASGNKVSRESVLCGSQNIVLNGKSLVLPNSIIRGDLSGVRLGRYCVVCESAVLRPAAKLFPKGLNYFHMTLGDAVWVGPDAVVQAASIGSYVRIGARAVISPRAVILDACLILPDSVVPEDAVIPPFSVYGGNPAVFVRSLPEASAALHEDAAFVFYETFDPDAPHPDSLSSLCPDNNDPGSNDPDNDPDNDNGK